METILETKELTKRFFSKGKPSVAPVDRVSFRLEKGETLGIVGESGSGKSTLAKLITRLIDPTSGSILLNGQDIAQAKGPALRRAYRQMQMVFQSPRASFDPRKTIGYGIEESLSNQKVPPKERTRQVVSLLEQCGLPGEWKDRYPHEISGGQCQRAAIARALAVEPSILICDEATSALDMTVQKQIMELLARLRREKDLSLLFICHDLALVQSFCHRILVMQQGKVVEEGIPEKVILSPSCAYTRQLVEASDWSGTGLRTRAK